MVPAQPLGIALEVLLHAQGGVAGALGMVFVGNGSPKQREDAIAQGLRHIALVAMHRGHHTLQGGIDDAPRLLGVQVLQQRHGALDVGEQGGNGLALTVRVATRFQGRLLGQDALGQVARRVGDGAYGSGLVCRWPGSRHGCRCGDRTARPHQDAAPFVDGHPFGLDEFLLEALQVVVI